MMQLGWEFAFDYKSDQLGLKATHLDEKTGVSYVLVDGYWHLGQMPDDLADAVKHSRLPVTHRDHVDADTLASRLRAREKYQLTRHGTRQPDGYQRYLLPNPIPPNIDLDTGEVLSPPTNKTVTIPGTVGLKWAQKHPFLSKAWQQAFNRRTRVEQANAELKRGTTTDLDNADSRPQRSFAAASLAVATLVAAHNLIRIQEYLAQREGTDTSKSPTRAGRRLKSTQLTGIGKQLDGRTRATPAA